MRSVFVGCAALALASCIARDRVTEDAWSSLPSPDAATVGALGMAPDGSLHAGTFAGLFVLEDDGDAWRLTTPTDWMVSSVLALSESIILVGVYRRGIWRSADGGATWAPVGFEGNVYVDAITKDDSGRIFAAVARSVDDQPTGIFRSDDEGRSWVSSGLAGKDAYSIVLVAPDSLYAGTKAGTYRSIDGGTSWTRVAGLPESVPLSAMVRVGRTLVAGFAEPRHRAPGAGAWVSIDEGETWRQMTGLPPATAVHSLVVVDGELFAATGDVLGRGGTGVYSSTDFENWQSAALVGQWLGPMVAAPDGQLHAGANEDGVFSSVPGDDRWVARVEGLRNWHPMALLASAENRLYALTVRSLFRYETEASVWTELPIPSDAAAPSPFSFAQLPNGALVIPGDGTILVQSPGSLEWVKREIPDTVGPAIGISVSHDGRIFATFPGQGVYESGDSGNSWRGVAVPEKTRGIVVTSAGTVLSFGDGLSRRTESGAWRSADLDGTLVFEVIECRGDLFLASAPQGVLRSRDDGRSWAPIMESVRERAQQPGYIGVHSLLCLPDGELMAATFSDGLHLFNERAGWTDLTENLPSRSVGDLALGPNGHIYVATPTGVHQRLSSTR